MIVCSGFYSYFVLVCLVYFILLIFVVLLTRSVHRHRLSTYGRRAFAGPTMFNTLPDDLLQSAHRLSDSR